MNVFEMRKRLIADYAAYVGSFIEVRDERIRERVDNELQKGRLQHPSTAHGPSPAEGQGRPFVAGSHRPRTRFGFRDRISCTPTCRTRAANVGPLQVRILKLQHGNQDQAPHSPEEPCSS